MKKKKDCCETAKKLGAVKVGFIPPENPTSMDDMLMFGRTLTKFNLDGTSERLDPMRAAYFTTADGVDMVAILDENGEVEHVAPVTTETVPAYTGSWTTPEMIEKERKVVEEIIEQMRKDQRQ